MKTNISVLVLLAIVVCVFKNVGAAQTTPPVSQGPGAAAQKTTQILIPAHLTTDLDSRKLKPGDVVVVQTVGKVLLADGKVIPRGTKVVGHVTQAKAQSGGDAESSLQVVFDKIDLPDGKVLLINGVIRAIAPNIGAPEDPSLVKGIGGFSPGPDMQRRANWPATGLTEQSEGVEGIEGLHLYDNGLFKSDKKTVLLYKGSQIMLRVLLAGGD